MLAVLMLAVQAAPDLQLDIRAHVRDVRIERKGDTSLELWANPDAGSRVQVDKPEGAGRRRLRNVDVRVRGEARIGDPADNRRAEETAEPR